MLGRPRTSLGLRGSWLKASAGSDVFDFVTDTLSVEKSDFNTGAFAAEVAFNISPRLDIVGAWDMNSMSQPSDYRLLEDNRGLPIEQVTELSQYAFTLSAKFALLPRGNQISRLAWIPRTFVPYVGAGAGYGHYQFRQNGDFVDYSDNRVFSDTFNSEGWAPTVHILGGTDIRVYRHMTLSFEGKYSWQHADLGRDFVDFDPIDLGGFRFGAGVHLTF